MAEEAPIGRRPPPVVWIHDVEEDGVVAYRMGRQGRRLVAEWPSLARLTCTPAGTRVQLRTVAGAPASSVAKLQGVVKALLGDLRGGLGMHASAVALGTRAVLFVGKSGAGKSTAAAELCHRYDAKLLADDAAVLEERGAFIDVLPSEDHHFLSDESSDAIGVSRGSPLSMRDKTFVRPPQVGSHPCRLALVVCLRFDDSIALPASRRLSGADAALRVIEAMFRFDVGDRGRELDRIMRVYQQAPFVEIVRPRSNPSVAAETIRNLGDDDGG